MSITIFAFISLVGAILFAHLGWKAHYDGDIPRTIYKYFIAVIFAFQHLILFTIGYLF